MNSEIVHACQALTNEFSLIFQQQEEYKMRLDLPVTLVNKLKNCVPVNEWNGFSFIFFFNNRMRLAWNEMYGYIICLVLFENCEWK